ncbi:dual specificity protein phosphatase 12, partial [Morone saxatilis]|uniref:dual specificity protein phosphatase 12 n=1 Tax=Morone saxatilis TaxID=34816 RepID=UPI0015E215FF
VSQAGRSRSATIVTAYLMKRYQLGFTEAYHRLKGVKQDVHALLQLELQHVPRELFAVDPAHSSSSEVSYRCRKCRRTLFRESSILSHPVGEGAPAFGHKKSSNLTGDVQCTSYFIEPVQWMEQALLGVMDGQV